MSLNRVVLQGRLTKEPELRHTTSSIAVATFTIAVDRNAKDKQTDFINCTAWRGTAEHICKWFKKGSMILLEGSIQTRQYTDKDGKNRTAFEIVADQVYFCEGKQDKQDKPKSDFHESHPDESVDIGDFEEIETDGDLPF